MCQRRVCRCSSSHLPQRQQGSRSLWPACSRQPLRLMAAWRPLLGASPACSEGTTTWDPWLQSCVPSQSRHAGKMSWCVSQQPHHAHAASAAPKASRGTLHATLECIDLWYGQLPGCSRLSGTPNVDSGHARISISNFGLSIADHMRDLQVSLLKQSTCRATLRA